VGLSQVSANSLCRCSFAIQEETSFAAETVDDVMETASGDFTSQSIAGSSFWIARKPFQLVATSYQVAGDVFQLETICSNAIQDPSLSFPILGSSLRSLRFPILGRTAFAGQAGTVKSILCADWV